LPPELLFLAQIFTKSFFGWDIVPDPTGGTYSVPPPDPLTVWRGWVGSPGKGNEKRGREGKKRMRSR